MLSALCPHRPRCVDAPTYKTYLFSIIGIQPSVTAGPPITLAWACRDSAQCTIDEWEEQRGTERRSKGEFRVPEDVRTDWLIDAGYSNTQVSDAVCSIQKERQSWKSSIVKSSLHDKADVMAESVKRRIGRLSGKREKSNVMYTQWRSSQDDLDLKISSTLLMSDDESPNRFLSKDKELLLSDNGYDLSKIKSKKRSSFIMHRRVSH